jgi:hypothetical protein
VTGFVADDERALAAALSRTAELDRGGCRKHAAERFSTERMVADHLDLYARAARTHRTAA